MDKTFQKIIILLFIAIGLFLSAEVKADTFGYEATGGSEVSIKDVIYGTGAVISENGTATSLHLKIKYASGLGDKTNTAIYNSSFNKVQETTEKTSWSAGWVQLDFATQPSLTSSNTYYLVSNANHNKVGFYDYQQEPSTGYYLLWGYNNSYTNGFPASLTTPTTYQNSALSIYATYTPSGGAERRIIIIE